MHNLTRIEATQLSAPLSASAAFTSEPDRNWTDYLRMVLRRWYFVPAFSIFLGLLAYFVSIHQPKVYQSTAEVLIQSPASTASTSVSSSQYAAIANILGVTGGSDLTTQIEMMTNDQAMKQVAAENHFTPAPIPSDFKAHFDIEPYKTSTEIVTVTASADSPRMAARLIKSLVAVYNHTVSEQSSTAVGRLTESTRAEMNSIGNQLARAEAIKAAYSKSIGSVDLPAEATQKVGQLYTLRNELLTTKQNLAVAQSEYNFYSHEMQTLQPNTVPNISFASNPRIDADKAQLEQLETQRVVLSAQYTPNDQQMIENQKQIDTIEQQMATERAQESRDFALTGGPSKATTASPSGAYVVTGGSEVLNPLREEARQKLAEEQADLDSGLSEQTVLSNALNSLHSDVVATPDALLKMDNYTSNVEVLRTIYSDLQAQSAQLQARLPAEQSSATFLSGPIIPKKMFSPKPELFTALGAVLGLLFGCMVAIIVDNGDIRLRDNKDAELLFGRPLLQSISWNNRHQPILETDEDIEPYKELAFTLGYLGVGKTLRSILVTSSVKDEGGTAIASNLAVALSKEGQRVVLIDANFKRPKLHVLFGQKNEVGLLGLMKNGTQPGHAMVQVEGSDSLRLISVGSNGEALTAGEAMNAEKFETILDGLKDNADIVIVDAPAVFEGFETSVLADKVDGIIFVTRSGHAARATVRRAFDLLQNCRALIIGSVVTIAKE